MFVQKRNGRRESVHFDKITSRISKLCGGLDSKVCYHLFRFPNPSLLSRLTFFILLLLQHVEPVVIAQKVIQGVYPGVTTVELDE